MPYIDPGTSTEVTPAGSTLQEQNLNANKAGLDWQPPTGGTNTPAVIATSNASRTDYNNNVNTIKTANTSVGNANQKQGLTPDGTTTATPAVKPSPDSVTMNEGTARALFGSDFTGVTTNADGTFSADKTAMARVNNPTGTNTDSSTGTGTTGGTTTGMDPDLRAQLDQNIKDIQGRVTDAQSTIDTLKANATNDPAMIAAADAIRGKFDKLIQQMTAKNDIVAGQNAKSLIQGGAILGQMGTNFMSDQTDKAIGRVADLVSAENAAILRSNQAYQSKNVLAIANAAKELNTLVSDKTKAVLDLNKAIDANIKQNQADIKATQSAAKQEITDNIRVSSSIAGTVAQKIKDSGVTDPKQIDAYIQAEAKANGITNPEMLSSAVKKEQGLQSKADLAAENTASIIKKRNQGGTVAGTKPKTDGSLTYTRSDVSTITSLLNKGGTTKDGTYFAPRGKDGFVDPQAYIHAYNSWVSNGGTPKGFIKEVPPAGNINPQSYNLLPPALKPK